jgi:hypothetical protein
VDVTFRRLVDDDLPLLHRWLNEPGVVRWWEDDDVSWDGVVRDYGRAARRQRRLLAGAGEGRLPLRRHGGRQVRPGAAHGDSERASPLKGRAPTIGV